LLDRFEPAHEARRIARDVGDGRCNFLSLCFDEAVLDQADIELSLQSALPIAHFGAGVQATAVRRSEQAMQTFGISGAGHVAFPAKRVPVARFLLHMGANV